MNVGPHRKRGILNAAALLLGLLLPAGYAPAQPAYGVTGLLHAPSATMQREGTVLLGGNFLNRHLTPPTWSYNTYNYYLSVTLFAWLEVAYTCTLFQSQTIGIDWKTGPGRFTNQDRYFSVRVRALKEGRTTPAVVVGASDPFTETGDGQLTPSSGNGFFSRYFVAAGKQVPVESGTLGLHLSWLYNRRNDYPLNGPAGGISYSPRLAPDLTVMADYDSKDVSVGGSYLLWGHLQAQVALQRLRHVSGGVSWRVCLK